MRAVNLLPKDAQGGGKSLRQEDPAVVIGSALGAVVMIALVGAFLSAHGKVNAQQKELTADRLTLAQVSEKRKEQQAKIKPVKHHALITPIVPSPAITGQEASWLGSVSTVLQQRIAWDRILREVSLVIPDDVTLSALTMTAPSTAATTAQGFSITGNAYSYDSVARLLSRLSLVPDLSAVTLSNTGAGQPSGVSFSITANLKGAPAPVAPAAPAAAAPPTDTTASGSGA